MIILVPEKANFKISTTNLEVFYEERSDVLAKVDVLLKDNFLEKSNYNSIVFSFKLVAELKCISMNFFEAEHHNYQIIKENYENTYTFWSENGYHPDPGIYLVRNSHWLSNTVLKYDPLKRFSLQHFLITGNDSYIEVLASTYKHNLPGTVPAYRQHIF